MNYTKVCTSCKEELPATSEYFHKQKYGKYNLRPECKQCRRNRSATEQQNKKLYNQSYYQSNKSKCLIKNKEYYALNKTKIQQQKIKYQSNRLKTNPYFRMTQNLRRRINSALHGKNKSQNTLSMIGCTIEELKLYLEKQFTKGMSWDNYGEWHIDHIKPCASFDLSLENEQKLCFHYTNLQPLWAEDNLRKSYKTL